MSLKVTEGSKLNVEPVPSFQKRAGGRVELVGAASGPAQLELPFGPPQALSLLLGDWEDCTDVFELRMVS